MEERRRRYGVRERPPGLLLECELGRRWRKSVRTLQRWRSRGTGPPYIRLGARIFYRLDDVLAFEDDARRAPGPDE